MKKTTLIYLSLFLCVWAQEGGFDAWQNIIRNSDGVFNFSVNKVEKTLVGHWKEDSQNQTTAINDSAKNCFWALSLGGFLSGTTLELIENGADIEYAGRTDGVFVNDPSGEKHFPIWVYKIFTHSSQNYEAILREDRSFINLLAMEKNEIASDEVLQLVNSGSDEEHKIVVNFVRRFRRQETLEFLSLHGATLDSLQRWQNVGLNNDKILVTDYFVKMPATGIVPMINSGFVTGMSMYSPPPPTSNYGNAKGRTSQKLSVSVMKNTITFSQNLPHNSTVNIYAPNGRIVYSSRITGRSHSLPNTARGVYLLKIKGGTNTVFFSKKIML